MFSNYKTDEVKMENASQSTPGFVIPVFLKIFKSINDDIKGNEKSKKRI